MKTLVVIVGPTGVGKTELSLSLAEQLGSPVISCDSRQIYKEIPIGTAAATEEEQTRVKHYFVGTKSVVENYNAGQYERDALALLNELFLTHDYIVMTGGSMLYVDAVCKGLDNIPSVPQELRDEVQQQYKKQGLEWLQEQVRALDPDYWNEVDQCNPARLMHCLEICLHTNQPYSSFRKNERTERPFRIVKIGLDRPRQELYDRINRRVERMMEQGLLEEVKAMMPYRHLNSLQTVGYKELFKYLDGEWDLKQAVAMIQQNSRHYAKRQLTWFRADGTTRWFYVAETTTQDILDVIDYDKENPHI